jgi:Phosphate acetyl/butaryl transferase
VDSSISSNAIVYGKGALIRSLSLDVRDAIDTLYGKQSSRKLSEPNGLSDLAAAEFRWSRPRLLRERRPRRALAIRPIADIAAYAQSLQRYVFGSGFIMRRIFATAKAEPKRVIQADCEEERVLHAVQMVPEEGEAVPMLFERQRRPRRFASSGNVGRHHALGVAAET